MEKYTSVHDVPDVTALLNEALQCKKTPWEWENLGKHKTLGLLFFNPSLRTRMSTQKAASHLGLQIISMNIDKDGWKIETEEGVIMDGDKAEHIKEAAGVISQYCDILGVRSFPGLINKQMDYQDEVLQNFIKYASVPVLSLESAIRHPLQSLADLMTIEEHKQTDRPKVVLTWAPHPKPLPQAVGNSFAEWMNQADVDLVITCPEGYELDSQFTGNATITHNQNEALEGADFVYAKNWSSTASYGQVINTDRSWTISKEKMALTNQGKFMHCLPVRRNMVVTDDVLDSPASLVLEQANNRTYSAQAVLKRLIK
ncbi:N-acetylornithine carbamoyltransferase [Limibacter armeniacum]|uniref:N-acetylornithine carbamoyltransferase n=1 Tax=Limibacter armeniacum TaxID=466084 RepID=UPI002FE6577C